MRRAALLLFLVVCGCGLTTSPASPVRRWFARNDYLSTGHIDPEVWNAMTPEERCRYFKSDGKHGRVIVPPPQKCNSKEKK